MYSVYQCLFLEFLVGQLAVSFESFVLKKENALCPVLLRGTLKKQPSFLFLETAVCDKGVQTLKRWRSQQVER